MNLAERKAQLERELESISHQMQTCDHEYGETQYDPQIVMVPYSFTIVKKGSDIWEIPKDYIEEKQDRWSQTCIKCGYKRFTTKTIPTAYKPVF